MDPKRRAALLERRERLRHELYLEDQLIGLEDLAAALTAAGEAFEILYRGQVPSWAPAWIPQGYSRIPWELIVPAEDTWFRDDLAARDEAFADALRRCAEPDEPLLFVFEGRAATFRMTRSVAERHVGAILDGVIGSLSPLWITSPPRQWLIEVSGEDVRVGDTLATADAHDANAGRTGRAAFDAVVQALDVSGTSHLVFNDDDPERPDLPDVRQECPIAKLRMTVAADDHESVRATVLDFIAERVPPDGPVQIILTGTPRIQLSRADFIPHVDALLALAADINLSAPGAGWVISIRRRTRTWIEGVG